MPDRTHTPRHAGCMYPGLAPEMNPELSLCAQIESAVARFVIERVHAHSNLTVARIAVVYDEGSSTVFPITLAVLSHQDEAAYYARIESDADLQWLWNPEEFTQYATAELMLHIDDALAACVHRAMRQGALPFRTLRTVLNRACALANIAVTAQACFSFTTDPALLHVRENVQEIGNIPVDAAAEMPSWF